MTTLGTRWERIRWRFMLAAERLVERVDWAHRTADLLAGIAIKEGRFDAFVDRVSPWEVGRGYRRTRLRRNLYRVRYARRNFIQSVRGAVMAVLSAYVKRPGRYEGNTSQLIAEWLDGHSEYALDSLGDTTEYGSLFTLFTGSFPWGDGDYIMQITDQGFVSVQSYDADEVKVRWAAITQQYEFWASQDDELAEHESALSENELRYMYGNR